MKKLALVLGLVIGLVTFTSCEKDSLYDCGIVVGGYTEYNAVGERFFFYLTVEYPDGIINESVDERSYFSYFVGDPICF